MATSKTVLIVDDSKLSRMMISKFILHAHPDWNIIEASNGSEAVEKANNEHPDFITMDYNMDGLTGIDATELILQHTPNAIISMFTANIQSSSKDQAESLGIHFVGKPVTENSVRQILSYFESRI